MLSSSTSAVEYLPLILNSLGALIASWLGVILAAHFALKQYKQSKIDQREAEISRAANMILSEIRYAESQFVIISSTGIRDANNVSIMPFESWHSNKHLFVSELDRDEYDLVSRFFESCIIAQRNIDRLNSFLDLAGEEKAKGLQHLLIEKAKEPIGEELPQVRIEEQFSRELERIHMSEYWFVPNRPKIDLEKYLRQISNISTTTAGEKLKKLAQRN